MEVSDTFHKNVYSETPHSLPYIPKVRNTNDNLSLNYPSFPPKTHHKSNQTLFSLPLQEKLVQEAMRQLPPTPSLASALYPGIPMPMYATSAAMTPLMHVAPHALDAMKVDGSEQGGFVHHLPSEYYLSE